MTPLELILSKIPEKSQCPPPQAAGRKKTGARAWRNSGGDDTHIPSFRHALAFFLNIAKSEKNSQK